MSRFRSSDILALATESMRVHRLRTGLTLAAIAIGVTAVLLLTALGEAAKRYVVREFADIGSNLVIVLPGHVETTGAAPTIGGAVRDLTIDDAEAVQRQAPAVRLVAPLSFASGTFSYGGRNRTVYVAGTTPSFETVRNVHVASGTFLDQRDPRRGEGVVVIGRRIQREVFRGENPLGKAVRLSQWRLRVVGVMEERGHSLGMDFDDVAIVPVATGLRVFNQSSLFRILVQARDPASVPQAVEQVRAILKERHDGEEDFTILTQDAMLATFGSIIEALTAALAGIAAISLAVAGIGIMNVMLVSVSERTTEVGLLKALGGRRRQIESIFLAEAVLLSGMGAAIGVGAGLLLTGVAAWFWPALPLQASIGWIAAVLVLALASGGVFGLLPARRAARLAAADALQGRR